MKSYKPNQRNGTISSVTDAVEEISTLRGEMEDWYENLPQSLQDADRGQRVQEAANALEQPGDSIDVPSQIEDLSITYIELVPKRKRQSPGRGIRLDNALSIISAAKDAAQEFLDDEETSEDDKDGVQEFIDKCEEFLELEGAVEFPSMFG